MEQFAKISDIKVIHFGEMQRETNMMYIMLHKIMKRRLFEKMNIKLHDINFKCKLTTFKININ